MTCDEMREALLSADLAELRGTGAGEVVEHLRQCDTCRADAARILAATAQLGAALAGRRLRRIRRVAAPLALAAGVALFVLLRPRAAVVAPVAATRPVPQVEPANRPRPPVRPAGPAPRVAVARTLIASPPAEAVPVTAVAYAAPQAFAPEALHPTPSGASAPPRHPTLLHTADPKIAVLWFE